MKINELTIIIVGALLLSACGSSGSNNMANPGNNGNHDASPLQHAISNGDISGYVIEIPQGTQQNPVFAAGPNIDTVIIDGKALHINDSTGAYTPLNEKTAYFYSLYGSNRAGDAPLRYARSGYFVKAQWDDNWQDPKKRELREESKDYFLFYQGIATADMPTSGTAQYIGKTITDIQYAYGSKADSTFDVDFGEKTLTGTVSGNNINLALAANIHGNTFSGKKGNITTQGGFYGPAAAELAGSFYNDDKTVLGSFGASKK